MTRTARLAAHMSWRPEGAVAYVYDASSDALSRTNATGLLVLEELERGRSLNQIAETIGARYGIGSAQALADAERFVGGLAAAGLVEWADETT